MSVMDRNSESSKEQRNWCLGRVRHFLKKGDEDQAVDMLFWAARWADLNDKQQAELGGLAAEWDIKLALAESQSA
jgi:outer membrane PBP1 activator LpoA protein